MNSKTAMVQLAAYREGKPTEPRLAKALKCIENDSLCREKLAEQIAFDAGVGDTLRAIAAPADLRKRLEAAAVQEKAKRPRESYTAILAVIVGVLVILGTAVFLHWEGQKNFPGRETLVRLVTSANNPRTSAEMEIVGNTAGQLGDWFYMRGFDAFELPPELKTAPALGSRVFQVNGSKVAQIAIEPHESLVYVYKGDDLGVQLPSGDRWCVFEAEGWAAATRKYDSAHVMISFKGTEGEMDEFLKKLPTR